MVLVPTDDGVSLESVCKTLFGEVLDVEVLKSSPDPADLNSGGAPKKKGRTAAENVALATNAGGVVAGPGAVYAAYRGAKNNTGGFPRDVATAVGQRRDAKRGGKPGILTRTARTLNEKTGRRGKIGAAVAGGTMVGLQMANMAGDAIATRTFAEKGKEKQLAKRYTVDPLTTDAGKMGVAAHKFATSTKGKALLATGGTYAGLKGVQRYARRGTQEGVYVDPYAVYGKRDGGATFAGEFSKFDDDKKLAFGWASIVRLNGMPVVDKQGDYIDIDDLEEAAYTYVHKSRVGGDMHRRTQSEMGESAHKVSDMVESIVFTDDKIAKMGLPDDFPRGWWVGFKIHDDKTWDLVRKKERTGFSIHGKGIRKDVTMDSLMGYES